MTVEPGRARLCGCETPLLDLDTCLRCGRPPTSMPALGPARPPARQEISWSQPKVIRAIQAFAFFRGRPPLRSDWQRRMPADWPPLETVEALFGSLEAATRAAEIDDPSRSAAAE